MTKNFFAPIVEAMKKYSADKVLPFHTPGHKHGRGAHEFLRELLTAEGFRQEVSLMDELDDLHAPHACIRDAQILAAKLWHADETIFFVNGTTSAIQAMIFGTLNEGDKIFVPRNAHRSVISGLILSGALPIFLPVEFDAEFNLPLNVTVETVERAIKKFPSAKALLLVSPNYYGVAADVKKISELVHAAGMLLLVDEAHGAHLQFSDELPPSAMDSGADVAAQSTHKILGSLTQTSMLMIKNSVDVEKIRRAASLLQTTSPNQILLASLDIARLQMEIDGREKISAAVDLSRKLRGALKKICGLKVFDGVKNFSLDTTKVTVNVSELGLTGTAAEEILRYEFKIQCELSDATNLLFLLTFADDEATVAKLIDALKILSQRPQKKISLPPPILSREISSTTLSPRETFYASTTSVPPKNSVGKICAEEITFYPPGIPLLMPGEEISAQVVELLEREKIYREKFYQHAGCFEQSNKLDETSRFREKLSGTKVIGASDPTLSTLTIVR